MSTASFEKQGPKAAGEQIYTQHRQAFTEQNAKMTNAVDKPTELLATELTGQAKFIQRLATEANLTLPLEDLKTALKAPAAEVETELLRPGF